MTRIINHCRVLAPLAAAFVAVGAAPAFAQTVRLVAPLEKGQVFRYDLSASVEVTAKTTDSVRQHAVFHLTVAEVEPAGEATLRGQFELLEATWKPADAPEQQFTWKEGEELASDASPLAKAYGALGTTPIEVTLDRNGVVKNIDGPEKALAAGNLAKLPNPERALGVLAYHALAQTLGPIFTLDPDAKDRKAGDTWSATAKLPALAGSAIKATTERTWRSSAGDEATVAATITQAWQAPPGKADPAEPVGTPSDQKSSAEEHWDIRAGRLASRTQDTTLTWKLQLQTAPPLEASRTVRTHIELKRLEPAPKPPADEQP